MNRPRPAVRVAILVAAVACLGLAMCARSHPVQPNPPAAPTQAAPAPADAPAATKPQPEEGKMHEHEPDRFPATKAPGRLY